jgi:outer membrane protein TolC
MQQLLAKENNVLLREEIKSFNTASKISENILKMNRSFSKPRLNAFVDMAAQGFDFRVNRNSLFYLGGVQLQIPIYSGKRNLMKIEQTQYDLQSLKLSTEQLQEQLQLAALQSLNNAQNAYNSYLTNLKKQESAAQYFKLLERGYTEGVNSFIEFLDARNQLTSAQLQLNISKYRFLAGLAEFERQTAGYQLQ